MRKLIVSLDGVMQAPGGPEEDPSDAFKCGGWSVGYWDDAQAKVMDAQMSRPYEMLLGRKRMTSLRTPGRRSTRTVRSTPQQST